MMKLVKGTGVQATVSVNTKSLYGTFCFYYREKLTQGFRYHEIVAKDINQSILEKITFITTIYYICCKYAENVM